MIDKMSNNIIKMISSLFGGVESGSVESIANDVDAEEKQVCLCDEKGCINCPDDNCFKCFEERTLV